MSVWTRILAFWMPVASVLCGAVCALAIVLPLFWFTYPNTTRPNLLASELPLALPPIVAFTLALPHAKTLLPPGNLRTWGFGVFFAIALSPIAIGILEYWASAVQYDATIWKHLSLSILVNFMYGVGFGVAALIITPVILTLWPWWVSSAQKRICAALLLISGMTPLVVLGIWNIGHIFWVMARAEEIAAGDPYCVGAYAIVDDHDAYVPASFHDLTGLAMQMDEISPSNGSFLPGNIVVIEVRRRGWTEFWGKWQGYPDFDQTDGGFAEPQLPIVGCHPKQGYVWTLAPFRARAEE